MWDQADLGEKVDSFLRLLQNKASQLPIGSAGTQEATQTLHWDQVSSSVIHRMNENIVF